MAAGCRPSRFIRVLRRFFWSFDWLVGACGRGLQQVTDTCSQTSNGLFLHSLYLNFITLFLSASLCLFVNNSGHVSTFNWGLRPSSSSSSSEDKTPTWSRALFIFHLILIWKPWSWIKAVEFNPEGSEEPLLFDSIIIWADYQRILDFDLLIEFKSVHSFHFICVDELKCQRIKIFNEIWSNKNLIYGGIKIIKIPKTFVSLWMNRSD